MKELLKIVNDRIKLYENTINHIHEIEEKRDLNDYEEFYLIELNCGLDELMFVRSEIKHIIRKEKKESEEK